MRGVREKVATKEVGLKRKVSGEGGVKHTGVTGRGIGVLREERYKTSYHSTPISLLTYIAVVWSTQLELRSL